MEMKEILNRMLNHEELSREETKNILVGITKSEFPNEQITALLTAMQMRGITVDELLGFRDGILETGVPVPLDCDRYIDVVGTGGDRKNTFNISTTSCFVIAGAGYKVAKHGNYAATSTSGASNVIAHHGIKFTDDIDKLNRSINECGSSSDQSVRRCSSRHASTSWVRSLILPSHSASCWAWPTSTRCACTVMCTRKSESTTVL